MGRVTIITGFAVGATGGFSGLSVLVISGVAGVRGTGQVPEGNSMSTGAILGGKDC